MKIRNKETKNIAWSDRFNEHGIDEIIVCFPDGDMSSEYIRDYEVQLSNDTWVDMKKAFSDKDLITDNYDRYFLEPPTETDRQRGYVF